MISFPTKPETLEVDASEFVQTVSEVLRGSRV